MADFAIAVVSDLHAFVDPKKSSNSLLQFGDPSVDAKNPLRSLAKYVQRDGIKADVLLCPGDICNQADFAGFARAWELLQELKSVLGARDLIATCGNHDLDSRFLGTVYDDPDPKGELLSLTPPFPVSDRAQNNQFWARNFAVIDVEPGARIVVLNTSAYHGGFVGEIEHGRVSRRTINDISTTLSSLPARNLNVLLCHHHLIPMAGWAARPDNQSVTKGSELLTALEEATQSSWLIVHGHRHFPHLMYGPAATSSAPIIFGASSLGARVPGIPNQFHVIHVHHSTESDHASICGTVKTWSWTETTDWIVSGRVSSGLPSICGFGFKGQIGALAKQIDTLVGPHYISWEDAVNSLPGLNHLTPPDLANLSTELKKVNIAVMDGLDGRPLQIGRRTKV